MVNIEEFVSVIHQAVLRANEDLLAESFKLIGEYFEVKNPEELLDTEQLAQFEEVKDMDFQEVMNELEFALKEGLPYADILSKLELLKKIQARDEELRRLSTRLGDKKITNAKSLRAKMVTLQYPIHKDDKLETIDIQVPLITLIPIILPELTEVRFKTNLIVETNKDTGEVSVSPEIGMLEELYRASYAAFEETKEKETDSNEADTSSSIEIIITPNKGPESLRVLVDGLVRELRAQFPN